MLTFLETIIPVLLALWCAVSFGLLFFLGACLVRQWKRRKRLLKAAQRIARREVSHV
jgi:hypothetical protein